MDQETVKLTALKAIFDLLHFFGLEVFKVEPTVDKNRDTSPEDDDEGKDDCSDEFDDLTSDNSSEPQQTEKTNFGADVLGLLTDLLDSSVRILSDFFAQRQLGFFIRILTASCY
jgi:hypothetical protein